MNYHHLRARFEAWAAPRGISLVRCGDTGRYNGIVTQLLWDSWRACGREMGEVAR